MSDTSPSTTFRFGRGINLDDAPETIDDREALELINYRLEGRNRWTTRRALATVVTELVDVCGIFGMPHGELSSGEAPSVVYLDYVQNEIRLYKANGRQGSLEFVGVPAGWESSSIRPNVRAALLAGCLWMCDEERFLGLTCYDPNDVFGQGTELFQPYFKFNRELDTPPSPIFSRDVAAYNNFLFVCGYGDEAEPDQPEIVRFSYLGMAGPDDARDLDAALDVTQLNPAYDPDDLLGPGNQPYLFVDGGVEGLFDVEDYFPVGVRNIPVIGMQQGAERLVIATRLRPYILFGYDRTSFELDLLDAQHGLVATRAIGEADGVVYWWTPSGPVRWTGGEVIPLEKRIKPLIRRVNYNGMFFFHQPNEYEARWYHSKDTGDPKWSLNYNYLYDELYEHELGVRVSCGGLSIPGTILRPGPGGTPIPPPPGSLVQPTNLHCENPTEKNITWAWTPQETAPDIVTEFQWAKTGEEFGEIIELESSVDRITIDNLEPETSYDARVRHVSTSGGETSIYSTATCSTTAPQVLSAPAINRARLWHGLLSCTGPAGTEFKIIYRIETEIQHTEPGDSTNLVIEYENVDLGFVDEQQTVRSIGSTTVSTHIQIIATDSACADCESLPGVPYCFPTVEEINDARASWRVRAKYVGNDPDLGFVVSPWSDQVPVKDEGFIGL